jgi:peptidoglycan/LPS O-acetylase OafA/YrhL
MRAAPERKFLPWVQALRAFAALCVAFHHIAHDAIKGGGDPRGWLAGLERVFPWDAGVDMFFVISGFVIVHASAGLFGRVDGPGIFLRRRLQRIVPLYWIMTTAFLAVLLAGRGAIHGDIGGPAYVAASYLFIPWARPDGVVQPAFGLGWTLNYEMFFYLAFTPFVVLPRRAAVAGAVCLLAGLVAAGRFFGFGNVQLDFWSDPIVLEFCAGMLAAPALAGLTLGGGQRLALVVLAAALLHCAMAAPPAWRAAAYGLPALALLAAAATARPAPLTRSEAILARLGGASYALYLVHPFVMRAFTVLWHKFHAGNELAGTIYVLAGLLASQGCALAINMTLERKMGLLLRGRDLKNETV